MPSKFKQAKYNPCIYMFFSLEYVDHCQNLLRNIKAGPVSVLPVFSMQTESAPKHWLNLFRKMNGLEGSGPELDCGNETENSKTVLQVNNLFHLKPWYWDWNFYVVYECLKLHFCLWMFFYFLITVGELLWVRLSWIWIKYYPGKKTTLRMSCAVGQRESLLLSCFC